MKLSTLIEHVGDDNIQVQNIAASFHSANYSEKKGATITFYTDPKYVKDLSRNLEYTGLVVWIPRDKLPEEVR